MGPTAAVRAAVAGLFVVSLVLVLAYERPERAEAGPRVPAAVPGLPGLTIPALPPLIPAPVPLLPPGPTPVPGAAAAQGTDGLAPYRGLGTWVDVYDWSQTFARGGPTVQPADVAAMAASGAQTLFIQAGKHDAPTDVLEPRRLGEFVERARAAGLKVVAWYLPTLEDVGRDLARLRAIAALPGIDGLAVDIESRRVGALGERNRRLVELSRALRQALPGRPLAAIVMPPVQLEVVNPGFWPAFPYRDIAPSYDLWMTMGYWTDRTARSGYRDPYAYTKENVVRLRRNVGDPHLPVHPIGGIGTRTTVADVEAYKRAVTEVGGFGGGLYDWATTSARLWPALRPMRAG